MEKAERIQYQAAFAITGTWQGSNRSKLYDELGWESLSDRRWCRRVLQIHKIVTNGPSYLKNKLPRFRRPLYSQNNTNTFHGVRCKSSRYMNIFFPDGINSWNNVITHFNDIPSIGIIKKHILSLIRPEKKCIFGIHDPSGLRNLFQLRVGLRYHKKCHNFIHTPSNKCPYDRRPEDINHFLFSCPLYAACRITIKTHVIKILQNYNLNHLQNQSHLYLYGQRNINFADNRIFFLATIKFIKESKRFPP